MSTGPNHRRGHGRIQHNNGAWEKAPHCARARRGWQNILRRRLRRILNAQANVDAADVSDEDHRKDGE